MNIIQKYAELIGLTALAIGFIGGYFFGISGLGSHQTAEMGDVMHGMTASLEGKTGDTLDAAFIDGMIVHHEGAVEMAQLLLAGSEHAELRGLAERVIAAQTAEIEQMRGWREELPNVPCDGVHEDDSHEHGHDDHSH